MNSQVLICVILVITIIILWNYRSYHNSPRARKQRKYRDITKLDNIEDRQAFLKKTETPNKGSILLPEERDADDLFTRASIYLRMQDDIADQLQTTRQDDPKYARLAKQLGQVTQQARQSIRAAIDKRNEENHARAAEAPPPQIHHEVVAQQPADEADLFHDDAIVQRAIEIEDQAARLWPDDFDDLPMAPLAPIVPHIYAVAGPHRQWAPDPENVHDSAVGEGIQHRLQYLQQDDFHLFNERTCIGAIAFLMKQRLGPNDAEKREKIMRTLNQAQQNAHCSRYKINELEALRLALEHAMHAKTEETKNNLHDALLTSIAECAPSDTGTVCLVGRISRYAASMDGIDDQIADVVKPVDAYRTEILNSIGKVSANTEDENVLKGEIHKICDQYKDKMPTHVLEKIRNECLSSIS